MKSALILAAACVAVIIIAAGPSVAGKKEKTPMPSASATTPRSPSTTKGIDTSEVNAFALPGGCLGRLPGSQSPSGQCSMYIGR